MACATLILAMILPSFPACAEWKLANSETLPAPGDGVTHICQTLRASEAFGGRQATLHFVGFKAHKHSLKVFDQGLTGRSTLGDVMQQNRCLAGVNGGYFQPDFEPVGMLVSDGRIIRGPQHAKLLSGALVVTTNHIKLLRSTDPLPGKNAQHALQAGPFLVDGGKTVPGLNDARNARRTVILTDGKGDWALVSSSALTLAEIGLILAEPSLLPHNLKVDRALNLDGGSSTSLWVAKPGGASPFYISEFGIVRDFVGIVPRSK
jgi:uncharacterized protein YigE (DUF2233 family)